MVKINDENMEEWKSSSGSDTYFKVGRDDVKRMVGKIGDQWWDDVRYGGIREWLEKEGEGIERCGS